jgi:hypothetical protein
MKQSTLAKSFILNTILHTDEQAIRGISENEV